MLFFIRVFTCTAFAFYPFQPPLPLFSFLPVSPFFHFLPARGPPLENVTAAILSYCCIAFARGHRRIADCADTVGHLTESVPSLQSEKNDLPLSVSMCRPRTGVHPSKYRPSAKLLDLGARLVPDTYHTSNAVATNCNLLYL